MSNRLTINGDEGLGMRKDKFRAVAGRNAAILTMALRVMTWRELIMIGAAAILIGCLLIVAARGGYSVGSHLWRPGWSCNQTAKGAISCAPDPTNSENP